MLLLLALHPEARGHVNSVPSAASTLSMHMPWNVASSACLSAHVALCCCVELADSGNLCAYKLDMSSVTEDSIALREVTAD